MAVQGQAIGHAMESAPGQESMGDGVMVYQKTSQCCRCCCCQPNIDWTVHDYKDSWGSEDELPVKMTITEDAPYWGRCWSCCCPAARSTVYTARAGEGDAGQVLFTHEKALTCSNCPTFLFSDSGPARAPCCCCLPYLETKDASGNLIGKSVYVCDACLFIPKYEVQDKDGNALYRVRPETCCGGLCVRCHCGGQGGRGKCFRIPFLIRRPEPPYEPVGDAAITNLWAGAKHECCTNREMYGVKFPAELQGQKTEDVKRTLIGTTILVDITMNEQDQ